MSVTYFKVKGSAKSTGSGNQSPGLRHPVVQTWLGYHDRDSKKNNGYRVDVELRAAAGRSTPSRRQITFAPVLVPARQLPIAKPDIA
jgi:hypothetical protein